jgi:hypothetical protein
MSASLPRYRSAVTRADARPQDSHPDEYRVEIIVAECFVLGWSLLRIAASAHRGYDADSILATVVMAIAIWMLAVSTRFVEG